jgi:hypothetical protein
LQQWANDGRQPERAARARAALKMLDEVRSEPS